MKSNQCQGQKISVKINPFQNSFESMTGFCIDELCGCKHCEYIKENYVHVIMRNIATFAENLQNHRLWKILKEVSKDDIPLMYGHEMELFYIIHVKKISRKNYEFFFYPQY